MISKLEDGSRDWFKGVVTCPDIKNMEKLLKTGKSRAIGVAN